jgi:hypothetical protein
MTTAAPGSNTTAAIAEELVSFCRGGNFMDAINTLYSPDIVSVEEVKDGMIVREHFFYRTS